MDCLKHNMRSDIKKQNVICELFFIFLLISLPVLFTPYTHADDAGHEQLIGNWHISISRPGQPDLTGWLAIPRQDDLWRRGFRFYDLRNSKGFANDPILRELENWRYSKGHLSGFFKSWSYYRPFELDSSVDGNRFTGSMTSGENHYAMTWSRHIPVIDQVKVWYKPGFWEAKNNSAIEADKWTTYPRNYRYLVSDWWRENMSQGNLPTVTLEIIGSNFLPNDEAVWYVDTDSGQFWQQYEIADKTERGSLLVKLGLRQQVQPGPKQITLNGHSFEWVLEYSDLHESVEGREPGYKVKSVEIIDANTLQPIETTSFEQSIRLRVEFEEGRAPQSDIFEASIDIPDGGDTMSVQTRRTQIGAQSNIYYSDPVLIKERSNLVEP